MIHLGARVFRAELESVCLAVIRQTARGGLQRQTRCAIALPASKVRNYLVAYFALTHMSNSLHFAISPQQVSPSPILMNPSMLTCSLKRLLVTQG